MKILVFIKQVPDTDKVKLDPVTGNLKREGVSSILNPNDANVIEAAIQLKAKYGGSITAITMGPPQAAEVLRKALSLGCDNAYLLSDRAFGGADTLATSYTLAKAAEKIGDYDLLLFGRNAVDGDTAQTGPATAAHLNLPQITQAISVDIDDGWVICERESSTSIEKVAAKLPALVTIVHQSNKPHLPTLLGIKRAYREPITVWDSEAIGADKENVGILGSPSVTKNVFEPEKKASTTEFIDGSIEKIASRIADILDEKHLI